ncbi:FAD/NAD(P)-dependent oxidoreductase [Dictyobacter aurantiacus]|uniref:Oxidoreductase n=1 Tax=Dictyobacter aurantiacus TaxID=1936993 RepID=A0A401ZR80_9CHLR|nr:FAD/NAD(P)-binding oxidoreductase [Dictyobacter aurantiacus]GCE09385.1 oxidoreductase [Dictyobacter aurantiacus]
MRGLSFDIVIVGAGPAGLAAAASAARSGASIGLLDDNPRIGGQIWRGGIEQVPTLQARRWMARATTDTITALQRARVLAPLSTDTLLVELPDGAVKLHFKRLILATGARERFLPFPGWTLPGVMGAGGLQALVKGGLPIEGQRVVVAGSGPLLLAVASSLTQKGARVQYIAEQTTWTKLAAFGLRLPGYPKQLRQASALGWGLRGVPLHADAWVTGAHGTERLETVTIQSRQGQTEIACDYLACGFGLWPNTELATALGCEILDHAVRVDPWQHTSRQDIYCAGEATGIGGLDLALLEGQIAGFAASGQGEAARACLPERERTQSFTRHLEHTFSLRPELKKLSSADTIICRCEDVTYQEVQRHPGWRSAKLQTRCGMGPCQGRICGAATAFLFGWTQDSVRPPVTVGRVSSLIHTQEDAHSHQPEEDTQ